jgi:cellulose synthase/poly-beta-1,6-N-acetylglucosamine synthase-like glycosyltransferase
MLRKASAAVRPTRRRLAVVSTAGRTELDGAIGVTAGRAADHHAFDDQATGVPKVVGVVLDVPADAVSDIVRAVRARLTVGPKGALVGAAVADDPLSDEELVAVAGRALVSGHGVADDLDEHDRRLARKAQPKRALLRGVYEGFSRLQRRYVLVGAALALGWLIPFTTYSLLWTVFGIDLGPYAFWAVFFMLLFMAAAITAEGLRAIEPDRLPDAGFPGHSSNDPVTSGLWPTVSVIVAAYLPNEADVIGGTVEGLLRHDYPGKLDVIIACNGSGPRGEQALALLKARAADDARLRIVYCPSSTSKAENVNAALTAALAVAEGGVVGILDADHRLAAGACARAARWIAGGYGDVVQGHNVVRNGDRSWMQQMVAVEFEAIYAVAHPGRAGMHGFGIFGGSNGFWRADLIDRLRMRPWMLTEDIDISLRAVLSGARIVSDPLLVSRELAPETLSALWDQRIRWAQGWSQVSRRYLRRMLNSPVMGTRQRLGTLFLLGWREAYPWIAMQMFPVLAYQILVRQVHEIHWLLPFFVFAGLFTTGVGPLQALAAWRLAVPEVRRQKTWWFRYLFPNGAIYGEVKSMVNRCAHLREWLGDDGWTVTPRHAGDNSASMHENTDKVLEIPKVIAVERDGVVRARALRRPVPSITERRRASSRGSAPGGVERRTSSRVRS